jgi:hypothetical protein
MLGGIAHSRPRPRTLASLDANTRFLHPPPSAQVVYCNAQCQKSDWQFHKRICSTPAPAPSSSSSSSARPPAPAPTSTSAATSSSAATSEKPLAAKASTTVIGDDGLDEEDLAAIQEVKAKGYRYFSRKLDSAETAAIGDIRPKAVAVAPAEASPAGAGAGSAVSAVKGPTPIAAPTAGGAGAGAGSGSPATPASSSSSAASSSSATASEWNKNGTTYESRNFFDTIRSRIKELLGERRRAGDLTVGPIPGIGRLMVTGVANWGDSSADVIITRGKTKKIYDLSFDVVVQVFPEAAPAPSEEELDEGGDDKTKKSTEGGDKDKGEEKKAKNPRALLRFQEVSNETEGSPRDISLKWGSPSPPEAQHDVIRTALAVSPSTAAGPTKIVRDIVERVIQEFKEM